MYLQTLGCLGLGVVLALCSTWSITAVALSLAGYWLLRAVSTGFHAVHVAPDQWAGRGLVAVLMALGAYLFLHPVVFADIPVGVGLATTSGGLVLVAGIAEMQIADRRGLPAMNLLGLVNALVGVALVARWTVGPEAATAAMGWLAVAGGALATYAVVELSRFDRREFGRRPTGEDG